MVGPQSVHPILVPAWEFVAEVRRHLLETIRPLTAPQWAFRADAKGWCIGQAAEHLLRSEIGSSKMARKLIRGDYRVLQLPEGAPLYTIDLDRYPYGRLDAPRDLAPGPLRDRADLERELAVAHERFRGELSRFQGEDPEALRSPDPATGVWYTLGGWVKLQGWHEAHHIAQIQRLIAAANVR